MTFPTLDVAVCQPGEIPTSHEAALSLVRHWLDRGPRGGLVVMPELALCGYGNAERIRQLAAPIDGKFVAGLCNMARDTGTGLIAGFAERDGDLLYNSLIALRPTGEVAGHYRKVNLWGEHETDLFSVGAPSPIIDWDGFKIGLLICHDLDFPDTARDLAQRGADVLVVASATNQHYGIVAEKVAPTRAYENVSYVIYADAAGEDQGFSFLGDSRIISPGGAVEARLRGKEPGLAAATLEASALSDMRRKHPFVPTR